MLPCHINAFLIQPGRVLGRKLRPLTLAHYWILEAVDSPYVWGQTPRYSDMVFAVFTLSVPVWLSKRLLMRPALSRKVFRTWGKLYKSSNLKDDLESFGAYWQAYTDMPTKWTKEGQKSGSSCLPTSMNIAWAIMGKVGEKRAWTMPMPLALSYLVAESESNGGEYKSERDIAMTNKEG